MVVKMQCFSVEIFYSLNISSVIQKKAGTRKRIFVSFRLYRSHPHRSVPVDTSKRKALSWSHTTNFVD